MPPLRVNLIALLSRFQAICSMRTGSPSIRTGSASPSAYSRTPLLSRLGQRPVPCTAGSPRRAASGTRLTASLPVLVRDMSSRSSMIRAWLWTVRRIVVAARMHRRQGLRLGQRRQQLGVDVDQVERMLQLVRHHRQELVLQLALLRSPRRIAGLCRRQPALLAAPRRWPFRSCRGRSWRSPARRRCAAAPSRRWRRRRCRPCAASSARRARARSASASRSSLGGHAGGPVLVGEEDRRTAGRWPPRRRSRRRAARRGSSS